MKKRNALLLFLIWSFAVTTNAITGGGSDGGGNTYRGKPLESYAKSPSELPGFKTLIEPLLADLLEKASSQNSLYLLRNLLKSLFTQKIWYFVPGPLEQIPPELLNSAVRTDQAILQGFDRVWIDEDIWKNMSASDQEKLLLHEVFMNLKILMFASPYRLCEAAYPDANSCDHNQHQDADIRLTSTDYFEVQRMTIQVSSGYSRMNNSDWTALINQNGIKFPYDWFEEKIFITPSRFADLLSKATLSNFLPQNGYNLRPLVNGEGPSTSNPEEAYNYLQTHKEKCDVKAHVDGKNLYFQLSSNTKHFNATLPLNDKIQTHIGSQYFESRQTQQIGITHYTHQPRPQGGYTIYNIAFSFDLYRLAHVFVQEMVCEDKDCKESVSLDVKDGFLYVCSDNPNLFKPKN